MFRPLTRLFLLLLCVLLSLIGAYFGVWPLLIFSLVCSIGLLWGYYKTGTVILALNSLRRNDFDGAEKLIDMNQRPELLNEKYQAYYYFINGMITREKDMFAESKAFLIRALEVGMKNESDRAMALLSLADMEMVAGNEPDAKAYFLQIKDLKVSASLMPAIRKMQEWLQVS